MIPDDEFEETQRENGLPSFEEMGAILEQLTAKFDAHNMAVIEEDFIAKAAYEHWENDGLDFYLRDRPMYKALMEDGYLPKHYPELMGGPWNGYVRFPKLPGILNGYGGIYRYVPVHGGITFFQEWADGSVTYGFDTLHLNSVPQLVNDKEWMKIETESMGSGIRIAARFERYYLNAGENNYKKARVLDRMGKFLPLEIKGNMGVMSNILKGEL